MEQRIETEKNSCIHGSWKVQTRKFKWIWKSMKNEIEITQWKLWSATWCVLKLINRPPIFPLLLMMCFDVGGVHLLMMLQEPKSAAPVREISESPEKEDISIWSDNCKKDSLFIFSSFCGWSSTAIAMGEIYRQFEVECRDRWRFDNLTLGLLSWLFFHRGVAGIGCLAVP